MAISTWSHGGRRHVALRTDNQNVLSRVGNAMAHSPAASRILRNADQLRLYNKVDVSPAYVRSGRNLFSDGLTRWTQGEVDRWANLEGMPQIYATAQLWAEMSLSYNPSADLDGPPNNFAL